VCVLWYSICIYGNAVITTFTITCTHTHTHTHTHSQEQDGMHIPSYVWDADPLIQKKAVSFVFEDSFADAIANDDFAEDLFQVCSACSVMGSV
jgi:hypothetical protein